MQIFAVIVKRDDEIGVVARDVVRETRQFYYIADPPADADWSEKYAFNWSRRINKGSAFTSARSAVEHYMKRRQTDKQNALTVAGQCTKQIASANELLMHLPEAPPAADAVDPHAGASTDGPRATSSEVTK
jgi:hypothetical protein